MEKLVTEREDVAFYIKMFPLNPKSRAKAKAIVCAKSLELLEASLAGKEIPPADCETDQLEQNIAVGRSIGVRSTPTLVLPDGRVLPGYKTAAQIGQLLQDSTGTSSQPKDVGRNVASPPRSGE
jgi:thiol:disulfide interchange protein DsbC